jgi:hypothetical protein
LIASVNYTALTPCSTIPEYRETSVPQSFLSIVMYKTNGLGGGRVAASLELIEGPTESTFVVAGWFDEAAPSVMSSASHSCLP